MDKRFWGFLIAIALVLGGIFIIGNANKAGAPGDSKATLTNHVEGKGTTGVKLVEYGDYQCPACGQYFPAVKQVVDKYGDRITFQFRNFPLFQLHPNAIAAARAAEAAGKQGKYWEMHDLLYENQQAWTPVTDVMPAFVQYAEKIGLNTTKFNQDYKSAAVNNLIQADLKEGNRLGIDSTPTFFLDGKKISPPDPTVEAFSKVIDAEIAKKAKNSDGAKATPPHDTSTPDSETPKQ